ncbi:IclR family transcriptional regulator [Cellulosimicrobium sp. XJ-DQ-B-000]|uniref:IclR family transcriptional regulator n=1 Tax=Cellulosimicrobium sp. XJ-DQ-B-000 TaxID=3072182 RepID=UPI0028069C05|nr:IclR family transcriptional regulator [Cellulosimicrobium sp. XJ-DQ-B-000]MDQ8040834.1 IclR family transcriptional regulator [Cellulosimicrobium sp. XJ-DQ-B-000]
MAEAGRAPSGTPGSAESPLGSVDKALVALEALASAGPEGVALGDLARSLGLHKASLHRTLAALRFRGYAEQDATTGDYRLGPAATALATVYLGEENLPALLHPVLVAVCRATDELVHLGTLAGTEIVYLDKVEPARAVRVWSAVGRRRPAATTALGRALLSQRTLDDGALAWYAGAAPEDHPVTPAALRATCEATRATGFATETEENEPGISCVAVPVLRAGQPVAAVSVTAPAERLGPRRRREIETVLREVVPPLLPPTLAVPDAVLRGSGDGAARRPATDAAL